MNQNKNIGELLSFGKEYLSDRNIDTSIIDAQLLLMHVLNLSKIQILTHKELEVDNTKVSQYIDLLCERGTNKPIQYILGNKEFMSLDFDVNSKTLIPRADTEILVETILNTAKTNSIKYIMDIGTGTGCIAISLLYYNKNMKAVAVDRDIEILQLAKTNAIKHKVEKRIKFIESNLFENVDNSYLGKFDAIISNPPYIPSDEINSLMPDVKNYEPITALDGGYDGLNFYREITLKAKYYIKKGGFLFYEIGYNQSNDVSQIMLQNGLENIQVINDLASLPRVVVGNKNF